MILLTALLLVHFVISWVLVDGVVPAIWMLASLIRVLASVRFGGVLLDVPQSAIVIASGERCFQKNFAH